MQRKDLEKICADWHGVTTDVKWDFSLVFSVADKMFAIYALRGKLKGTIGFKVADELFLAITEQPGIIPAPYAARFKWVTVIEPQRYPIPWFAERIRRSYELVAAKLPKKKQRELGLLRD